MGQEGWVPSKELSGIGAGQEAWFHSQGLSGMGGGGQDNGSLLVLDQSALIHIVPLQPHLTGTTLSSFSVTQTICTVNSSSNSSQIVQYSKLNTV